MQREFPDNIAHKPVFLLPYWSHDSAGPEDTDAHFLSLGWAQWNDNEISAKVVRHSGERWSRQSEELPLGRVIDLAILILMAAQRGRDFTVVPSQTFENQPDEQSVAWGAARDREWFTQQLRDDETLMRRIATLEQVASTAYRSSP